MLCEFASGARGTFEASRTIVGPESQMAFEVYGTEGALSWNLERMNELQVYLAEDELHTGYRTVFGGERFPYHGNFVPGSANGIGFEDLVVIEDFEFMRSIAERAAAPPRLRGRAARSCACRRRCWSRCGSGRWEEVRVSTTTATLRIGVIGVGRIGCMHAELLARRVPGAAVTRIYDVLEENARDVGEALGVPVAAELDELLGAADVDAVAICTSTDTHADLIVAAARGRQGDLLREAGVARPRRGRPRARRRRGRRRAVPDRLQPPLRPRPRGRAPPPWPAARSASRSSCGSPAATPRRRRWRTCASPAGSSST